MVDERTDVQSMNNAAMREALESVISLSVEDDYANVCLKNVIEKCEEALSAQKAHWIGIKYDDACCSHCGEHCFTDFDSSKEAEEKWNTLYRFCPHCGAMMDLMYPFHSKKK